MRTRTSCYLQLTEGEAEKEGRKPRRRRQTLRVVRADGDFLTTLCALDQTN